ncbi:MAG: sensor histidine kinase [Streptomyces sp.]|nr:sensor histidine kinase [Streptomyces sp.]
MSPTRPWTARVSAVPVVACVWALSTLYLLIAPLQRVGRPWGAAAAPRHPYLDDPRKLAALAAAAALLYAACRLLARRPAWAVGALVLSALVLKYDVHASDITPDEYLPVCVALCFATAAGSRRTAAACAAPAFAGLLGYVAVRLATGLAVDTAAEAVVLLIIALAWALGDSQRRERLHAEEMRARTAEQAVTSERLRIARELHDMVAHTIGVVALQAGAARLVVRTRPESAEQALGVIEGASRETLAGLRRMLGALHGADAADAGTGARSAEAQPTGLGDIDALVATARTAGVRVDVEWRGERRPLPPEIDLSVFRVIQESVTNVMKHSGTRQCRVSVDFRGDEVALAVVDSGNGRNDGASAAGSGSGYGITGMRDRVELLHGDFSAGPRPEGGFRVAARVPLPAGA